MTALSRWQFSPTDVLVTRRSMWNSTLRPCIPPLRGAPAPWASTLNDLLAVVQLDAARGRCTTRSHHVRQVRATRLAEFTYTAFRHWKKV